MDELDKIKQKWQGIQAGPPLTGIPPDDGGMPGWPEKMNRAIRAEIIVNALLVLLLAIAGLVYHGSPLAAGFTSLALLALISMGFYLRLYRVSRKLPDAGSEVMKYVKSTFRIMRALRRWYISGGIILGNLALAGGLLTAIQILSEGQEILYFSLSGSLVFSLLAVSVILSIILWAILRWYYERQFGRAFARLSSWNEQLTGKE